MALQDEQTQRRGIVVIAYYVGADNIDRGGVWAVTRLFYALPMRVPGLHGCSDQPTHRMAMVLAQMILGADNRMRTRFQFGACLLSF